MQIRPEEGPEQKLRAGFQRRVDQQSRRYAGPLAHAAEVATGSECGEVVGVFTAQAEAAGSARRAYVVGLAPLAAIPVLIAAAAARIPGVVPLLASFPFLEGAWFGVSLFRGRVPKAERLVVRVHGGLHAAGRGGGGDRAGALEPGHRGQ